jgi:hypothetical protein
MTELSYLWTTSGSPSGDQVASYTQAHWAVIGRILAACSHFEGVAPNFLNEFAVTFPSANTARVASGGAVVDGKPYQNDSNVDVNIPSATGGGNTRIDRIVLRVSWSGFSVRLTRIAGVSASSPTPPAITQTSGTTYDIMLYQVRVTTGGTVTLEVDERQWAIVATDDSTLEDDGAGTLRVKSGGITATQLASNAVTTAKITDANVTLAKMAADSVDDTKAGNRVPQFYRRQGGDASNWSTPGTTTQTPGAVRMQAGSVTVPFTTSTTETITITFPTTFSQPPLVFLTTKKPAAGAALQFLAVINTVTSTQVSAYVFALGGATSDDPILNWLAIGPE